MPRRKRGPGWAEIHGGTRPTERREFTVLGSTHVPPSSIRFDIRCPFCAGTVQAYYWSLSGSGKRCDCGALLGSSGNAYHWKGKA